MLAKTILILKRAALGLPLATRRASEERLTKRAGLIWFPIGFALVLAYTMYVHGAFWGKVRLDQESSLAD